MGGGDLNLKKSWHPTTLKNMERVWKAEQKHEAEVKKIEELQKELEQERAREEIRHYAEEKGVVKKKADRLDWMYEGPSSLVNREEYLLGRNVDKTFELMQQEESGATGGDFQTDADTIPESILRAPKTGNVTIDLANKIREDPLLVIKKQEEQSRKDLLHNPVRLKQLQMMLQQMSGKKKKSKKDKKKDKKKRRSSSSEDEEKQRKHKSRSNRNERNHESVKRHSRDRDRRRRHSSSPSDTKLRRRHRSPSPSPPPRQRNEERRTRHKDNRPPPRRYSKSPPRKDNRETNNYRRTSPKRQRLDENKQKKLDAAEKEKRLQEMISNAQWRDEQRNSNMKRHLNELKEEEDLKEKTAGADIMTPLLHQAARIGSVESRIKSNIYNIQRTKADLEKSFTRR